MGDRRILVVGIGDEGPRGLPLQVSERIAGADILYGGERQLGFFPAHPGERRIIRSPLRETLDEIGADFKTSRVVVLASGDPLFYGIGSALVRAFGRDSVEVVPHVSSVQLAFARAGESWHGAAVVSLHGKPILGLAQKLHGATVAALLTDGVNTPSAVARYLLRFSMNEYEAFVAERLGSPEERCGWYSLDELADAQFAPLNVVVLRRRDGVQGPVFSLGLDDGAFSQRSPDKGLITKREVRVLALSELGLRPGGVLWDIGACTGSVSIEAILSAPGLRVFAVEKNERDLENLRENQTRFRADFVAVHAKAPEGLEEFPDPDSVFIGGSGGELGELLILCAGRLRENGRVVVSAATIETLHLAHQTLLRLGMSVSVTLVQTARSRPILNLTRFEGMNPVYLVTARRNDPEEAKHDH